MKFTLVCLAFLAFLSCKQKYNESEMEVANFQNQVNKKYPEKLLQVFEAHGSLNRWKSMKTLEFTINKPEGEEKTLVDLKSRKSIITMPKHDLGYDGNAVWLLNKDTVAYKGNAKFYYNLMFYFNAMPFVLSDEGIRYTKAEPLQFEGNSYPGIKISYDNGIGESSDDEYILYYDKTTHKMTWLAYTVTYFSREKSEKFNFIKYDKWQEVNGLSIPEVLQWYKVENNLPTVKRNTMEFNEVKLSTNSLNSKAFDKPKDAILIN